jgi:hypothetical protein
MHPGKNLGMRLGFSYVPALSGGFFQTLMIVTNQQLRLATV